LRTLRGKEREKEDEGEEAGEGDGRVNTSGNQIPSISQSSLFFAWDYFDSPTYGLPCPFLDLKSELMRAKKGRAKFLKITKVSVCI
jgi:hypothetical protein